MYYCVTGWNSSKSDSRVGWSNGEKMKKLLFLHAYLNNLVLPASQSGPGLVSVSACRWVLQHQLLIDRSDDNRLQICTLSTNDVELVCVFV